MAVMAEWPSPTTNPAHYGIPPEYVGLNSFELITRYGPQADQLVGNAYAKHQVAQTQADYIAHRRNAVLFLAIALLAFPFLVSLIEGVLRKITRHAHDLVQDYAPAVRKAASRLTDNSPPISRGNVSTADELRKWTELRDNGVVTEDEFQAMRSKLLRR